MIYQLDAEEFLAQSKAHFTIDVRSEAEYNYAHIPHAVNLPLFNNEERKKVGTIYKQQNRNEAILAGLEIVGPKMGWLVRFVQPNVIDNKVYVHCWRGGMRSGSVAWLLNLFGFEVYVLKGGYKSYRQYVLSVLARPYGYIVLGGRTGSGKTAVLNQLKNKGEQVIDMEKIACHKGSAFGALGQPTQPSTEYFENLLVEELSRFNFSKRVWLEDESRSIGSVFLNLEFWRNLRNAPLFVLDVPVEIRIKRLVCDYGEQYSESLKAAITKIKSRIGNEQWKNAMQALQQKNYAQVAAISLHYYDRTYDKGLRMKEAKEITRFTFDTDDLNEICNALISAANIKYGN